MNLANSSAKFKLQLGHALSRVETIQAWAWDLETNTLQLGHALSRVETTDLAGWLMEREPLQLGHALSRVETFQAER